MVTSKRLGVRARRAWRAMRAANTLDFFPGRHLPRQVKRESLGADFRAGLNVALLAFPQGMAYAAIAGLPIQYGIYSSAIAAMLGPLFTGSRFIVLGPTNATSVLVFASFLSLGYTEIADKVLVIPLIVLLAGVFLVLGAFLKVAGLIQYISRSVVTGYITAAALYIILNQIKKVFGFDFALPEGSTFLTVVWLTLKNMPQTHWPTLLMSALTAGIYVLLSRRFKELPNVAITLVIMALVTAGMQWAVEAYNWGHEIYTHAAIDATQWQLTFPPLTGGYLSQVASVALIIAFLSVLEGTSIGKTLAARAGQRLDANQEMYGMGMANIACAFYQAMPASGSLTRSQLSYVSGAASPLASVICGLLCAIGAYAVGPLTGYIPVSVLGVLVIAIGLSLINKHVLKVVWNATGSDRVVFLTTFLAALLVRLDFAIILGAGVSVLLFLRKAAQPTLVEYTQGESGEFQPLAEGQAERIPEVSIVHVEGDLFFGAAELFREQVRQVCDREHLRIIILKMRNAHHLDATSVLALEELVRYMQERKRHLLVSELSKDAVRIFRRSGLMDLIGRENLFPDNRANPTLSTSKAIRRAMKLLDGQEADVKIFLGGSTRETT